MAPTAGVLAPATPVPTTAVAVAAAAVAVAVGLAILGEVVVVLLRHHTVQDDSERT